MSHYGLSVSVRPPFFFCIFVQILLAAGNVMIRATTKDTVLSLPAADDDKEPKYLAVQKGMTVCVDMVGLRENIFEATLSIKVLNV